MTPQLSDYSKLSISSQLSDDNTAFYINYAPITSEEIVMVIINVETGGNLKIISYRLKLYSY